MDSEDIQRAKGIPAMGKLVVAGLALLFGLALVQLSGASGGLLGMVIVLVVFSSVLAVTGKVQALMLTVVLLELPMPLDIYLFYNEAIGDLGGIGGLNISLTTAALAVLYGLWIAEVMVKGSTRTTRPVFWGAALPLAGYIGAVAFSILVASDRALGLYEVGMLVQMFLLYVYLLHAIRSIRDIRFIAIALMAGLVFEAIIMVSLASVGREITLGPVTAQIDVVSGRVGGTVGPYNTAAAYLSLMLALALGVLMSSQRGTLRILAMAGLALGAPALILTGSRGGWIALVLAAVILAYGGFRRGWLSPAVPFVMGFVVLAFAVIFQGMLTERLFPEDQSGALDRVPLMSLAGRMIADNPVFGVGANNFAVRAGDYWANRTIDDWLYVVHNKYLLILSESGLVALVLFVVFLLATIRFGWRAWTNHGRTWAPVTLGLTGGVLGHMFHLNVDIFNDRRQVQLLWVIAAVIAALYRLSISKEHDTDDLPDHDLEQEGLPILIVVNQDGAEFGVTAGSLPHGD